jgi:hypothetical protein
LRGSFSKKLAFPKAGLAKVGMQWLGALLSNSASAVACPVLVAAGHFYLMFYLSSLSTELSQWGLGMSLSLTTAEMLQVQKILLTMETRSETGKLRRTGLLVHFSD